MPQILPIKELKNTGAISELCHAIEEPVFITKNGYGDMVIMSMETYEKNMLLQDVFAKLDEAERDILEGNVKDAKASLLALRQKYGV